MAYDLPELPYGYDVLEPYVDEETMRLRTEKHHGACVRVMIPRPSGTSRSGSWGRALEVVGPPGDRRS